MKSPKKKGFLKRFSALVLTMVVTFSFLSSTIASAAALGTNKHTISKITDWGYNFQNSGLPNAYDPISSFLSFVFLKHKNYENLAVDLFI